MVTPQNQKNSIHLYLNLLPAKAKKWREMWRGKPSKNGLCCEHHVCLRAIKIASKYICQFVKQMKRAEPHLGEVCVPSLS